MDVAHPRLAPPSWLRLPRRTARLRLTALYGGLFLLSGVALVATTYVLFERATEYKAPHLPNDSSHPRHPASPASGSAWQRLRPRANPSVLQHPHPLAQAQQELGQAQQELAQRSAPADSWVCRLSWHGYSIR